MLSVAMLSAAMLSVAMLCVTMLSVVLLSFLMLCVVVLSVAILSVVMMSIITLSVVILSVIMLSIIMLGAIILNVIMLNIIWLCVVAPFQPKFNHIKFSECPSVNLSLNRKLDLFFLTEKARAHKLSQCSLKQASLLRHIFIYLCKILCKMDHLATIGTCNN